MSTLIKVEIIKRETIKPSSATPHQLRNFKLSLLDQLAPSAYSPTVLFYPLDGNYGDHKVQYAERSQRLKKSLSETLTRFYPFAGRIKDNVLIDCNDDGVDYLEARVNCRLSDILEQPEPKLLNSFLPIDVESTEASTGRLLLVQASLFECGGMTIGISISHKIADAATVNTFIKGWSTTAHESSEVVLPEFNAASLFPPISSITLPTLNFKKTKCNTRIYVFDASKIASLRAKVASASVPQPTRVEAVSALIWKCAMTASRSNLGFARPSMLSQSVNMRKRFVPPLADVSMGNLIGSFLVKTKESEIELQGLVGQLRKGLEYFCDNYENKISGKEGFFMICDFEEEAGNLLTGDDKDFYSFTSACRFPFYEADFGWGKPTWVSIASFAFKNVVLLMDTRDGQGIEAWVTLTEEDMALFELDQELLAFTTSDYVRSAF